MHAHCWKVLAHVAMEALNLLALTLSLAICPHGRRPAKQSLHQSIFLKKKWADCEWRAAAPGLEPLHLPHAQGAM